LQYIYENCKIENKELCNIIKDNKSIQKYFKTSFNHITPNNYCGFISQNNKTFFILPKIANNTDTNFNIFLYMLMFAYDINLSNKDLHQASTNKHKLLEIFIQYFANNLLQELKRGVYKSYITKEENLKVLKGKYVVIKNFSNFYHQNIYCEYDDFSSDNNLNQLFLYAIKEFKKISNNKNLYLLETILDDVTYIHQNINNLNVEFNRLNSRFKKSFDIALILLKHLISMPNSGKDKSIAFMFNMAEVFEKFIGRLYKEIDSSTKLQVKRNFGSLQLKPDVLTKDKIIDTKYKLISNRDDLAVNDKYQMFAYGVNFKIKDTMLLYPKHLQSVDDNLRLGVGEDMINLKLKSIDLNFNGGYDEFVSEIKKRLEEIG